MQTKSPTPPPPPPLRSQMVGPLEYKTWSLGRGMVAMETITP